MFDEETVERYTNGECARLAYAVHAITGWQVVAVVGEQQPYVWVHAAAQMPDGRVVDVEGVHTVDELCERWDFYVDGAADLRDLPFDGWEDDARPGSLLPPDAATRAVAERLVALVSTGNAQPTPVFALWNGGPSYSPCVDLAEDTEEFGSVEAVKDALVSRYLNVGGSTPVVSTTSYFDVFLADPREAGDDPVPDFRVTFNDVDADELTRLGIRAE